MEKKLHHKTKIGFLHLFKKFRWQVIQYWTIFIIFTILFNLVFSATGGIVDTVYEAVYQQNEKINDFGPCVPALVKKITNLSIWSKEKFIILFLFLLITFFLMNYLKNLWESKLEIQSRYYTKELLLDKFRQLPFEEREKRKKEINDLVEIDTYTVSQNWGKIFSLVLGIFVSVSLKIYVNILTNSLSKDKKMYFFSLFLISLSIIISYFFIKLVRNKEKQIKKELTKENALINKETNNHILIDSMGLSSQYKEKQKTKSKKNQSIFFSFNYINSLNKAIPFVIIISFPFLFLILFGTKTTDDFIGFFPFYFFPWFYLFSSLLISLLNYGDYSSSLSRINIFLALSEKDDNLQGLRLKEMAIKWIEFKNVSFQYQGGKEWVLENCQAIFNARELNKLSGDNGTGKTTILYLLLGMIKPHSGQILIHCQNGEVYNLVKDINLKYWRENSTAYFSHDNLIEEGSTGQRQVKSINSTLLVKKEAQIIIFDEATNALDPENAEWIKEKIAKLVKGSKIVIFVEHFK